MFGKLALSALALLLLGAAPAPLADRPGASKDIAKACGTRDGWADPAPPAHIHGQTGYVGTCGITVVLVDTGAGLVLIDTGPQEAVPHVLASIRALGFDPKRIRWILSTHEHFDHVGGLAAMQRETGADIVSGPFIGDALRSGRPFPDDPQAAELAEKPMEPVKVTRTLRDNGSVFTSDPRFTAHATPTHSPGSTSWTGAAAIRTAARPSPMPIATAPFPPMATASATIRAGSAGPLWPQRIAALPRHHADSASLRQQPAGAPVRPGGSGRCRGLQGLCRVRDEAARSAAGQGRHGEVSWKLIALPRAR